jgi:hypothetical protein
MSSDAGPVSRWNWIWLAPVLAAVLLFVEHHTISNGVIVAEVGWHRWSWGALVSPSAYLCEATLIGSVLVPLQGAFMAVAMLYSQNTKTASSSRRYVRALILILIVLLLPFITDTIIWGSFPFIFDAEGTGRLRLIPFIPWPAAPYGTY